METDANLNVSTISLTDKQIFKRIWTMPRDVFHFLNETEYDKHVNKLLILGGISSTFDRAALKSSGDDMSLLMIIILCSFMGLFIGWIIYYFYAYLLNWTGKWLNAQGNYKALVRMLAYALIPSLFGLGILFIQLLLFGNSVFKSEFNPFLEEGLIMGLIYYLLLIIDFALALWTLLLTVVGVSVVQKLSIGKSIINCLLPVIIFAVPLLVLYLLFN